MFGFSTRESVDVPLYIDNGMALTTVLTKEEKNEKKKNFLYWAIMRSNFQEAIQSINLHTFTNKRINVITTTFSVRKT